MTKIETNPAHLGAPHAKATALPWSKILMPLAWLLWLCINVASHVSHVKRLKSIAAKEQVQGASSVELIKASAAVVTAHHYAMLSAVVLFVLCFFGTKRVSATIILGACAVGLWMAVTRMITI